MSSKQPYFHQPSIVLSTIGVGQLLVYKVVAPDRVGQVRTDLEAGLAELVEPGVSTGAVGYPDHAQVLGRAVAVDCAPLVPRTNFELLELQSHPKFRDLSFNKLLKIEYFGRLTF